MALTEQEKSERPLSVAETAEFLGLSTKTIFRWIERGDIQATKLGKVYRIQRAEIDRLLREGTKQ
ncbi:helix-turn-helix domain-containing protein [Desulfovibrio cuneatus]|uniref:helix-turn-helix domain-containing protein n=1 Tax=Desulfovibrio cuneatus TaxID=159728 RepID=UPI00041F6BA3|nr:helix-turn-helix domain-containing protein [Desulfovibrio cuneatus]